MPVVDEVNRVVDGKADNHRDERRRHHVKRNVREPKVAAHENTRRNIRNHADKACTDAAEDNHQKNCHDDHRNQERRHLAHFQVLLHGGELRQVTHGSHLCIRVKLACEILQVLDFLLEFVGVVARNFNHQAELPVIVIHPVARFAAARVFVEQKQLSDFFFRFGNGVFILTVFVQRAVQILDDVKNGGGSLGKRVVAGVFLQLFQLFKVFDFLGLVVCTKVNHQVVRVEASDFGFCHVEHLVHVFDLAAHGAFHVKGGFYLGEPESRNCCHDGEYNRNRFAVSENELADRIKDNSHACIAAFKHLGVRLLVFAETQENRRNRQRHEKNKRNRNRRENAHGADWLEHHRQEAEQRHDGGKAREQHRPACFTHGVKYRFLALARKHHVFAEEGIDVNVVCNRNGEGQNYRNHDVGRVHVKSEITHQAEGHNDARKSRNQWRNDSAERTRYQEHHNDGAENGDDENAAHFFADVFQLLETQVGHACGTRVQRRIFFLCDDFSRFAARFHVGRFCLHALRFAFGLPHGIFGEGAQLDVDEGLLAVARNQLLCQFRLVGQAFFDFSNAGFVCRDFFGHNLRDFHALFGAEHVFQIDNRSRLAVGIRETVAQFI